MENEQTQDTRVNPQIHPKVVEAFESGDYSQTRNHLVVKDTRAKDGRRYCAMGLVCEIYRQETGIGRWLTRQEIVNAGLEEMLRGRFATDPSELFFVAPREPFSWEPKTNERGEAITYYHASATAAPLGVLEWAGLTHDLFYMGENLNTTGLSRSVKDIAKKFREVYWSSSVGIITMNDDFKVKFSTIAKVIREVPLLRNI